VIFGAGGFGYFLTDSLPRGVDRENHSPPLSQIKPRRLCGAFWSTRAVESLSASDDARIGAVEMETPMRTTVNLDESLLAKAIKLTGPLDRSTLLHESLKALIERESAKRLARLGGSQRELRVAPRRRQRTRS
jgi:Arc/MetJ family transcription regulator